MDEPEPVFQFFLLMENIYRSASGLPKDVLLLHFCSAIGRPATYMTVDGFHFVQYMLGTPRATSYPHSRSNQKGPLSPSINMVKSFISGLSETGFVMS